MGITLVLTAYFFINPNLIYYSTTKKPAFLRQAFLLHIKSIKLF